MTETSQSLKILRPIDAHLHLREGGVLKAVLPFSAEIFSHAVVMPNLRPALITSALVNRYRTEIINSLPKNSAFTPLMTLYLTDSTEPEDVERGAREGILSAAKLYPANATTNSAEGVSELQNLALVFERMQRVGLPLLIHGESPDPNVDIFDKETVFIERFLQPLRRNFPELRIVLEHITTEEAVSYVLSEGQKGMLAATITPHHLHLNRDDLFAKGLNPHYFCRPIAKREKHRQALIAAATSGAPMFFLGTDSAPHPRTRKECACGAAGIFSTPTALPLTAQIFDAAGALDKLEDFASLNAAQFYHLPEETSTITLLKEPEALPPLKPILTSDGAEIVPFEPPVPLRWRVAK